MQIRNKKSLDIEGSHCPFFGANEYASTRETKRPIPYYAILGSIHLELVHDVLLINQTNLNTFINSQLINKQLWMASYSIYLW